VRPGSRCQPQNQRMFDGRMLPYNDAAPGHTQTVQPKAGARHRGPLLPPQA
jgi:hypothetical protein